MSAVVEATARDVLLTARSVVKEVKDGERPLRILDGVSLAIAPGEAVALVGHSGSGKSTLLNILGGLDREYQGEVVLAGKKLGDYSDAALSRFRNRTLGFVFQAFNLIGHLTARDNVLLPARFGDEGSDKTRADALLERVGLGGKGHRLPATLSGGERQRVAIARALYHRPQLILCDEPTGNLDEKTAEGILSLFAELTREGVALLTATHDEVVAKAAHRRLLLERGRLA